MTNEHDDLSSTSEKYHSEDASFSNDYFGLQTITEQTPSERVDEVRTDLNELADELAYQLADQYITTDEPGSVLVGTIEDIYDDFISYLEAEEYEFEHLQYGSFHIQEVSKAEVGDLLRVIQPDDVVSVVDKTDESRSVDIRTTDDGYGDVVEHWENEGYAPERLPLNTLHIPEMTTEHLDELLNMTGVESVMGSEFL